jgi:Tol biopolymer transport system component
LLVAAVGLLLGAPPAAAQFIPYYGKNKVKYDKFNWHVYRSPHFEVYYYPEFEPHLGRLVSYAESAYERVSNELKHEIPFAIPLVLYKTHSEFEQTNLFPAILDEGIGAFAEPVRDRMVLPIDDPPDVLQGLIIHELTHIFEFDIIPRSIIRRSVPLWVDEGLSDYMRYLDAPWDPLDLMVVRDAAIADQIPDITDLNELNLSSGRLAYNLGHAVFEFMADRFGKEGIRQFLFALRKTVIGGAGEDVYMQAFRMKPKEFGQQFQKWLKERFKPYRDKQIPSDYGLDLSPDPRKTPFISAISNAPSPSGELIAVLTGNRRDQEFDVVLVSGRDGSIVKNLTAGYSGEFEYISAGIGSDSLISRSLAWTADGNQVAFFARMRKRRALVFVSALDHKVVRKITMVLDRAANPYFGPGGDYVYFSALRDGVGDIYRMDLKTEELTNLTEDPFYDKFPVVSPDGQWLYYSRRVSGNDKIYRLRLDKPQEKEQVTFGTFDDVAPVFAADGERLFYISNEDDDIFNVRSLDLESGDIIQYTDVVGGNFSPTVVKDPENGREKLMFTSYHKGDWGLYTLNLDNPVKEIAAAEVLRTEGPVIDFVPPVLHQVIPENKRKKGTFEKLFIEGRPPINAGVTSDGTFFGGSAIGFSDVLGDQNFTFVAYSVREFRTYAGSYTNLGSRFQYSVQGFDQTNFFYSPVAFLFQPTFSRRGQLATSRVSGGQWTSIYPFDKFRRVELSAGLIRQRTQFNNPFFDPLLNPFGFGFEDDPEAFDQFAEANQRRFPNGTYMPLGISFVQETTRFKQFGPISGSTVLMGFDYSPGGRLLSRRTLQLDARKYMQLTSASLFAVRFRGYHSTGEAPGIFYFGGNGDLRGYPFLAFVGSRGFFANAELRFPLIDALLTPAGFFGPIRGTFFAGMGGAAYNDEPFQVFARDDRISRLDGEPVTGFGLQDTVASYGFGLTLYLFGLPMHLDWTRLTDIAHTVPGTKFDFWIGFDF